MKDSHSSPSSGVKTLKSVFVRSALIMALTTIVVAGVLSGGAMRLFDRMAVSEVRTQAERAVVSEAAKLAKPIRFKVVGKIEEEIVGVLQGLGANGKSIVALDAEGNVLSSAGLQGNELDQLVALAQTALSEGVRQTGEAGRLIAEPILAAPEGPLIGVFALSTDYAAQRAIVWDKAKWIFALAGGTFVVMMGLTLALLHRALGRPLKQLARAVSRVAEGDYDTPSGMEAKQDEIGEIARNLDALKTTLSAGRSADTRRAETLSQQMKVVEELGNALDVLADGVLTHQISTSFPNEYESLRKNFNRAVVHLRAVVSDVKGAAENIVNNSNQIAGASDDLSRRTETQAATLEQSAAAMDEMLSAVKSAARNASEANKTVHTTRGIAEKNGEVMKSAIAAMGEIEKSSEQISEITSVIDDIAFQTNLLALNAGVEAARAGESGKGFAVVASEVRGLAQRSAEAAQQIKDLIQASGDQVLDGVKLVEAAGSALEEVLAKVADVSSMVEDIASSADDQAQGLNEINEGIAHLDRVTQQNAAMVEQSTAAAQMLHQEADALRGLVERFELGDEADRHQVSEEVGSEAA